MSLNKEERVALEGMLKDCLDKPDCVITQIGADYFAKILSTILKLDDRVAYIEKKESEKLESLRKLAERH